MPTNTDPNTSHDALDRQPKSSGVSVRGGRHPSRPSAAVTLARASRRDFAAPNPAR